jgi:hypothetical protein
MDEVEDFLVILLHQRKFEPVFGWVNGKCSGSSTAIEAMDGLALDSSEVCRLIQRTNNAVVTVSNSETDL